MGRIWRISPARPDALRVADVSTPKVSLSAQRQAAGGPSTAGTQAASPPSDPALAVTAPGSLLGKVEMKAPADEPDRVPPMKRMIWGTDVAGDPVWSSL